MNRRYKLGESMDVIKRGQQSSKSKPAFSFVEMELEYDIETKLMNRKYKTAN